MARENIALLFNSSILGGAERSIIHQVRLIKDCNITYFVPIIGGDHNAAKKLIYLINEFGEKNIKLYEFPKGLFKISRSSGNTNYINVLFSLVQMIFLYKKLGLGLYDTIWANGNKVGFSAFLFSFFTRFKKTFIWHFRDYPDNGIKFRLIWKMLKLKSSFKLILIGNSDSVSEKLKTVTSGKTRVQTIYNPVATILRETPVMTSEFYEIGVIGMLAPWKGIHEILLWSSLYEQELTDLKVRGISIYGEEIYQTGGEHTGYKKALQNLKNKLDIKLVKFCGLKDPKEIFNSIDIMIHSSIQKEPFGRVITESFSAQVPVISTGLGGAGELVIDKSTGLIYSPNDFEGLFQNVKKYVEDKDFRNSVIQNALEKRIEIESNIINQLNKLF